METPNTPITRELVPARADLSVARRLVLGQDETLEARIANYKRDAAEVLEQIKANGPDKSYAPSGRDALNVAEYAGVVAKEGAAIRRAIEAAGKAGREPFAAWGKAVISAEREMTGELEPLQKQLVRELDEIDRREQARVAAERKAQLEAQRAAEAAEAERQRAAAEYERSLQAAREAEANRQVADFILSRAAARGGTEYHEAHAGVVVALLDAGKLVVHPDTGNVHTTDSDEGRRLVEAGSTSSKPAAKAEVLEAEVLPPPPAPVEPDPFPVVPVVIAAPKLGLTRTKDFDVDIVDLSKVPHHVLVNGTPSEPLLKLDLSAAKRVMKAGVEIPGLAKKPKAKVSVR